MERALCAANQIADLDLGPRSVASPLDSFRIGSMAELVLFHHAQGLTNGVEVFAEQLRAAGHQVTVPDLFDGATFETVDEGVAHAERLGFDNVIASGVSVAENLPERIVYAGFSLGALLAHKLAQTRSGAASRRNQ